MLLAIDAASLWGGLALWEDGLVAELVWRSERRQTAELLPRLAAMFEQQRIGWANITGIAVTVGPGSFNGIRAGMASAEAFALARGVPLVGIGSLEALAWPYCRFGAVAAVMTAGRDLAVAVYHKHDGKFETLREPEIVAQTDFASSLVEATVVVSESGVSIPHGIRPLRSSVSAVRRPGAVAELGALRLASSEPLPVVQPMYLRRPHITLRAEQETE